MIIGIDLGTTTTSASAILDGKPVFVSTGNTSDPYILPSVVGFDEEGNIVVGEKAKNQYIQHPESTIKSVKSFMGTSQRIKLKNPKTGEYVFFTPYEISAKILEEIKRLAAIQFASEITQAVITVPAYFGDKARKDTIKAGELAGLDVVRIVNEPTAAALSYGLQNRNLKNHHIMVYDLGGGTFDISMLEINDDIIEVIASDGDRNLGGDNFDFALTTYISNRIKTVYNSDLRNDMGALASLVTEAEICKKRLSSSIKHSIEINRGNINYNEEFYRDHFEALVNGLLQKTLHHCKSVMDKSSIRREQVDKILLVGGSTRIPAVREMLENELKIQASQELDPDLAVVTGAAIQAAIVEGRNVDSILVDVAPHSLSISCVMEKDGKVIPNYCNKLIKKNTPIPCTVEEVFSTLNDNQETVRIAIYQGESDFEEDNTLIEEIKFSGLKSRKAGETQILLSFSYNLNGALDISVLEEGTDNLLKHNVNVFKMGRTSGNLSI